MDSKQTGRKRTGLVVALALCCILAVGGVYAWFSAQDSKTNTFIQGDSITEPEVKPDPNRPTEPGTEETNPDTDGNIIETDWNDKSPLTPGSITPKNPNMGIGKDSRPTYVFAMVENTLPADAYFVLGQGWKPVEGYVTEYSGAKNVAITDPQAKTYTKGLFVYVGDSGSDWAMLAPTLGVPENKANYTGELFDKIYTSDGFGATQITDDKNSITVSAYFAAASGDGEYADGNKNQLNAEAKKEIEANVKKWAEKVKA